VSTSSEFDKVDFFFCYFVQNEGIVMSVWNQKVGFLI